MSDSSSFVSTTADREAIPASIVSRKMSQSLEIVMDWQKMRSPSRLVLGGGKLRKLTLCVAEQPVNFMVVLHQSLTTAQNIQEVCRTASGVLRSLFGEEEYSGRDGAWFKTEAPEKIKKAASNLKKYTEDVKEKFRLLRTILTEIREDLNEFRRKQEQSAFLTRLSHYLSKDVRTCEDVLPKAHDKLEEIDDSLDLIVRWWRTIDSEASYIQMNSRSTLTLEANKVILQEIKNSFQNLERYFVDYVDKMGRVFDDNIRYLNNRNYEYLMRVHDCTDLVVSKMGRLDPQGHRAGGGPTGHSLLEEVDISRVSQTSDSLLPEDDISLGDP